MSKLIKVLLISFILVFLCLGLTMFFNECKIITEHPLRNINFAEGKNWALVECTGSGGHEKYRIITKVDTLIKCKDSFVVYNDKTFYATTPDGSYEVYEDGNRIKYTCFLQESKIEFSELNRAFLPAERIEQEFSSKEEMKKALKDLVINKKIYVLNPDCLNDKFTGEFEVIINVDTKDNIDYTKKILDEFKKYYNLKETQAEVKCQFTASDNKTDTYIITIKCNKELFVSFDKSLLNKTELLKKFKVTPYEDNVYSVTYFRIK